MSLTQKKKLFPLQLGVNLKNLTLTESGTYSVCNPKYAMTISKIILGSFPVKSRIVVTDATANNGGNTISFAQFFMRVNSVEIDPENYAALCGNIKEYVIKNVLTIHADYTKIYDTLKQHVVYIDPPWGGPNYKEKDVVSFKLGRYKLSTMCNMLQHHTKLIVLKVPNNFDIVQLTTDIIYNRLMVYSIYKRFQIILIYTDTIKTLT